MFRPYCVINPLTVKGTLWTECHDVVHRSNVSLVTELPSPLLRLMKTLQMRWKSVRNLNCECVPFG